MTSSKLQDLLLKNKAEKSDAEWLVRFNQSCDLTMVLSFAITKKAKKQGFPLTRGLIFWAMH